MKQSELRQLISVLEGKRRWRAVEALVVLTVLSGLGYAAFELGRRGSGQESTPPAILPPGGGEPPPGGEPTVEGPSFWQEVKDGFSDWWGPTLMASFVALVILAYIWYKWKKFRFPKNLSTFFGGAGVALLAIGALVGSPTTAIVGACLLTAGVAISVAEKIGMSKSVKQRFEEFKEHTITRMAVHEQMAFQLEEEAKELRAEAGDLQGGEADEKIRKAKWKEKLAKIERQRVELSHALMGDMTQTTEEGLSDTEISRRTEEFVVYNKQHEAYNAKGLSGGLRRLWWGVPQDKVTFAGVGAGKNGIRMAFRGTFIDRYMCETGAMEDMVRSNTKLTPEEVLFSDPATNERRRFPDLFGWWRKEETAVPEGAQDEAADQFLEEFQEQFDEFRENRQPVEPVAA